MRKIFIITLILLLSLIAVSACDDSSSSNSTLSEQEYNATKAMLEETVSVTDEILTKAESQNIGYHNNVSAKTYLVMFKGISDYFSTGRVSSQYQKVVKNTLLELDKQLILKNKQKGIIPAGFNVNGDSNSFDISGSRTSPYGGGEVIVTGSGSFTEPNYSSTIEIKYVDYAVSLGYIMNGTVSSSISGSHGEFVLKVEVSITFSGLWSGTIQATLEAKTANGLMVSFSGTVNGNAVDSNSSSEPVIVKNPQFTLNPGTYISGQKVQIWTVTAGASIRYTTGDGSQADPSPNSGTLYSGAININTSTTIKAIAYKNGATSSQVISSTYIINSNLEQVKTPVISPTADFAQWRFLLTCDTPNATIKYTTDGSDPKISDQAKIGTIATIDNNYSIVKAFAYEDGMADSETANFNFTIETEPNNGNDMTNNGDNMNVPQGIYANRAYFSSVSATDIDYFSNLFGNKVKYRFKFDHLTAGSRYKVEVMFYGDVNEETKFFETIIDSSNKEFIFDLNVSGQETALCTFKVSLLSGTTGNYTIEYGFIN